MANYHVTGSSAAKRITALIKLCSQDAAPSIRRVSASDESAEATGADAAKKTPAVPRPLHHKIRV